MKPFILLFLFGYTYGKQVFAPTVRLNDGLEMPMLGLGTWLGKTSTGRIEPVGTEVERAVEWALDAGYRHIDTAFIYKTEDQVGRAVNNKMREGIKREDLFITTKLWNDRHAKDAVVPALRESLKNLNMSYVDLYLIHWPVGEFANKTYDNTDYLDTWQGMVEAKKLGLTKSIGLSNFNEEMMERIFQSGLDKPSVLQVELNLNLQQNALRAYCKSKNMVVVGYTPFGSLLPSRARDDAPPPRIDDADLVAMAAKYNKTVSQIVLRYLVEIDVVPIPKSLNKSRIESNIDIFDFKLSEDDRKFLAAYDKNYRVLPQLKWRDHPFYPFEK